MADDQLIDDHEREDFAGTSAVPEDTGTSAVPEDRAQGIEG
jgi:hypothetical protein